MGKPFGIKLSTGLVDFKLVLDIAFEPVEGKLKSEDGKFDFSMALLCGSGITCV